MSPSLSPWVVWAVRPWARWVRLRANPWWDSRPPLFWLFISLLRVLLWRACLFLWAIKVLLNPSEVLGLSLAVDFLMINLAACVDIGLKSFELKTRDRFDGVTAWVFEGRLPNIIVDVKLLPWLSRPIWLGVKGFAPVLTLRWYCLKALLRSFLTGARSTFGITLAI